MKSLIIVLAVAFGLSVVPANLWAGPHESQSHKGSMGKGGYQKKDVSEGLSAEEHLSLADQFDQKAAAQEKEIAYHRDMMKKYNYKVYSHPKRVRRVEKMESHCKRIIGSLEKLRAEYKEMAQLHRDMLQEMDNE